MFTRFITGSIIATALLVQNASSPSSFRLVFADNLIVASQTLQQPSPTPAKPVPATVQISIDTVAEVLIENSDGKRIGLDFNTKTFVNEIPDARNIDRVTSSIFVLPADKSGKPYKVWVSGKSGSALEAVLSIAGPGFIAGLRGLKMTPGQIQRVSISADGTGLSLTANQDGSTPQMYFTTQSGRDKPSYRFEVFSSSLTNGKTINVNLDLASNKLAFKSDDSSKTKFSVMMRRTNPGAARETYSHQDVSFGRTNSYVLDFGNWDGKGDACFYEKCSGCSEGQCTALKNEYLPPKTK